jgi:hypothetical protein
MDAADRLLFHSWGNNKTSCQTLRLGFHCRNITTNITVEMTIQKKEKALQYIKIQNCRHHNFMLKSFVTNLCLFNTSCTYMLAVPTVNSF